MDENEIEEQNKQKEDVEKANDLKSKIVAMLNNKKTIAELADIKNNQLNLGGLMSKMINPIKRIIETAFTAHITADMITRKFKDASIKKFRDALQQYDFLRVDRFDLVQQQMDDKFPEKFCNQN